MALPPHPTLSLELISQILRRDLELEPSSFVEEIPQPETAKVRTSLYRAAEVTTLVRIEETEDEQGRVTAKATDAVSMVVQTSDHAKLLEHFPKAELIARDLFVLDFENPEGKYSDYIHSADPVALFKQFAAGEGLSHGLVELNSFITLPETERTPVNRPQWSANFIHLPAALQKSRGEGVVVAILDSGISAHQQFVGAIILPGTNVAATGGTVNDTRGHGTKCAGNIIAQGNHGLLGTAPGCSLLPIKITGNTTSTLSSIAAKGILCAQEQHAQIISISYSFTLETGCLEIAMRQQPDILFVVAAGDRTSAITDVAPIYPASFGLDNTLSVIGCTDAGERATRSTFDGSGRFAHIAAPGQDIECCVPGGNGATFGTSGTSVAAPQVAGVCALIWTRTPNASVRQIKERVLLQAHETLGLLGTCRTNGHVDADAAVP